MVGVVYALYCLDPTAMLNAGFVRPARAILPEGSVMNAVMPAAVGMRSLMCNLAQTAVIGAFCRALPDRMPASPGSGMSLMNVKTSTRGGRSVMASIGPVGGGAGGGPYADGAEGCGANMSFLKNTPVEINEAEVPVRILRYGLVPDIGRRRALARRLGAGDGIPGLRAAIHGDGAQPRPLGLLGLGPARRHAGADFALRQEPGHRSLRRARLDRHRPCDPGDIILIQGPGAGGYGDPLDRPADDVLTDVRRGFVSASAGAIGLRRGHRRRISSIDTAATARLRGELSRQRVIAEFGHGEGRAAFEASGPQQRYAALTRILSEVPVTWRFFVKHGVFGALKGQIAPPDGGAADVYRAYETIVARFEDLPRIQPDEDMRAAVAAE